MSLSRTLRRLVVAAATGAMTVSVAWAGAGLAPVPVQAPAADVVAAPSVAADPAPAGLAAAGAATAGLAAGGAATAPAAAADAAVAGLANAAQAGEDAAIAAFAEAAAGALGEGTLRVGASKVSLYPTPEAYAAQFPDARWERDFDKCATLSESFFTESFDDPEHGAHIVTSTANPWPENPDCLYQGGFGIGPANPIVNWDLAPGDPGYDESGFGTDGDPTTGLGLWARTVTLSDGADTLVLTVLDAEGYLWDYANKCDDCGARDLGAAIGAELGIDPKGIVIASTHSHAAMDFLGGWGFVPDWYMAQVVDAIKASVRQAISDARPAVVEVGEENARPYNGERRDTYRAAQEQQVSWLRAVAIDDDDEDEDEGGEVIATIGAFAAHPTTKGTNGGRAHADWPGVFERRLEDRFGGMGLHFMTGLGNVSARGGTTMGVSLANLLPQVGAGTQLTDTNVRIARTNWKQPVTNAPLSALGVPGFFDRQFLMEPTTIRTGENPETAPCLSASAYGVELSATAARIGSQFALTAAPGETFSNLTNTIKDESGALVTMPLAQANDALGYMPENFEMSPVGQQGLGFAAGGVLVVNYEDSYAIDHCTGDHVIETSLAMLNSLR